MWICTPANPAMHNIAIINPVTNFHGVMHLQTYHYLRPG